MDKKIVTVGDLMPLWDVCYDESEAWVNEVYECHVLDTWLLDFAPDHVREKPVHAIRVNRFGDLIIEVVSDVKERM